MSRSVSLLGITGSRTGEREKAPPPAQGDRGVAVTVLSPLRPSSRNPEGTEEEARPRR